MAYRDVFALSCPRCKKPLPPGPVPECPSCHGRWVPMLAAPLVLREADLATVPTVCWWRVYESCPCCEDVMELRGQGPGLFQGCDAHGYWIDADAVSHTGLADGFDRAAVERHCADPAVVLAAEAVQERVLQQRAAARVAAQGAEDRVRRGFSAWEHGASIGEQERARLEDPRVRRQVEEEAFGRRAARYRATNPAKKRD